MTQTEITFLQACQSGFSAISEATRQAGCLLVRKEARQQLFIIEQEKARLQSAIEDREALLTDLAKHFRQNWVAAGDGGSLLSASPQDLFLLLAMVDKELNYLSEILQLNSHNQRPI